MKEWVKLEILSPIKMLCFRIGNFFSYGWQGQKLYCNCCYDNLLDIMIFQIEKMVQEHMEWAKEMGDGKEFFEGQAKDIAKMKAVAVLLKRVRAEEYFEEILSEAKGVIGIDLGDAKYTDKRDKRFVLGYYIWKDPNAYKRENIVKINEYLKLAMKLDWEGKRRQEDFEAALEIMRANMFRWWV